jgi:hypothetical protein
MLTGLERTRIDIAFIRQLLNEAGDARTTRAIETVNLLRPARKGEARRAGTAFFKPLRQVIESINDT